MPEEDRQRWALESLIARARHGYQGEQRFTLPTEVVIAFLRGIIALHPDVTPAGRAGAARWERGHPKFDIAAGGSGREVAPASRREDRSVTGAALGCAAARDERGRTSPPRMCRTVAGTLLRTEGPRPMCARQATARRPIPLRRRHAGECPSPAPVVRRRAGARLARTQSAGRRRTVLRRRSRSLLQDADCVRASCHQGGRCTWMTGR
jgi:hypothetical protein